MRCRGMANRLGSVLGVALFAGVVTSLAAPAVAQVTMIDPYTAYIQGLSGQVRQMSSYGFDRNEILQIENQVRARPETADGSAYQKFLTMYDGVVDLCASYGFTPEEVQVLNILQRAMPPANRMLPNVETYRLFVDTYVRRADQLGSFGYTNEELAVLEGFARLAPPHQFPEPAYNIAYTQWTAQVQNLQARLASFGVTGEENRVISVLRRLQPQLNAPPPPQPPYPGQPYDRPPWPPTTTVPPVTSLPPLDVCGRRFPVRQQEQYWSFPKPQPLFVAVINNGEQELVEIDASNCQWRYITDEVTAFVVLPNQRGILAIRQNGTLMWARQTGELVQLMNGVQSFGQAYEPHMGYRLSLIGRGGRPIAIDLAEVIERRGREIVADGRTHTVRRLYRTVWDPLQ